MDGLTGKSISEVTLPNILMVPGFIPPMVVPSDKSSPPAALALIEVTARPVSSYIVKVLAYILTSFTQSSLNRKPPVAPSDTVSFAYGNIFL